MVTGFAAQLYLAIINFMNRLWLMTVPGLNITFASLAIFTILMAFVGLYIRIGTNSGGSRE